MRKNRIVALNGGLGNQMFQYAFAKMLEHDMGCNIEFDTGFYKRASDRTAQLSKYDIGDYKFTDHVIYNIVRLFFQRIPALAWLAGTYKEYDQFSIDSRVSKYAYSFYFGYWQNMRYFSEIADVIRTSLVYKGEIPESVREVESEMYRYSSVAVHVRRGDYLKKQNLYMPLDKDYYIRAINHACSQLRATDERELKLYFFSDDIKWCRENFADVKNAFFVDDKISESEHTDMLLMQNAACLVMANSTFSWWSAWLNKRPDRIVIAPDRWFCDSQLNEKVLKALIPENWILEPVKV